MDDHSTDEDVKVTPRLKHNYEELSLALQIDQTSPGDIHLDMLHEKHEKEVVK